MSIAVRIVYLDQNKWIDLARAAKHPADHPDLHDLLKILSQKVSSGHLALPLTFTNIYETHKINDARRRSDLASLQAILSRGLVFRGRHKRLEAEVYDVLRRVNGLPTAAREPNWFLSDVFFEAVVEWGEKRLGLAVSDRVMTFIRSRPVNASTNI